MPRSDRSDTSEGGLEALIVSSLTSEGGYVEGRPQDFDPDHAVDLSKLLAFLLETQPATVEQLGLDRAEPSRNKFLARLKKEIEKRGVVDVMRKGFRTGPASVDLYYGLPTSRNTKAAELFAANIFSVTRQVHYASRAGEAEGDVGILDLVLFVNGLPLATFELKNRLTNQTVEDAVEQYRRDRDPREPIFFLGRCLAHFAVDDQLVRFCTRLAGRSSWFLPFDKGHADGAGNPPNPDGLKTAYLWREVLAREGLADVLENYAQRTESTDQGAAKARVEQVFPRYHQLDAVRTLLRDVREKGPGRRYLVQHSAGSGKSNTISWLAHQLAGLEAGGTAGALFDSVVVVTDRVALDRQLRATIRQFAQVSATVGAAESAAELGRLLEAGKRVIITTVQKFPFVLDRVGGEHTDRSFAILIDEAHSGQGGRTAAAMNEALKTTNADGEDDPEDRVNRAMEARKMLPNASYFAFTATPKRRTLELFGEAPSAEDVAAGEPPRRPFHSYSMKQAIEEGFILDVLANFTPVSSFYRLVKRTEDDPEFDVGRAQKKLRRYVEGHEDAVRRKAEIMVDHFHEQVLAKNKVGGEARAMVAAASVERALDYYRAIGRYLRERNSPYEAIIAFSGERDYGGAKVTEASLNGFASAAIPEKTRTGPYRFLVVADKFQTGYDEPLLHTMYVDKPLAGVRAVQTLSRLNRAHPKKHDAFVLDFANDSETIREAFAPYYRATVLAEETDPDKLHDLKADLDAHEVYAPEEVAGFVDLYLSGAPREELDPALDLCVERYAEDLGEGEQVDFKGKAKAFVRTHNFLAQILPYSDAGWERLSVFLTFLVPKLPAPREEDLSRGILDAVDMDSYRAEAGRAMTIALANEEGELAGVPERQAGAGFEPETERLSAILREFNDLFGNIAWNDEDRVRRVVAEEIPKKVAADPAYANARKNSGPENARVELDRALRKAVLSFLGDDTELYRQFSDNDSFRRWLSESVFSATYGAEDPSDVGEGSASPP